jgi:hypothetical protein
VRSPIRAFASIAISVVLATTLGACSLLASTAPAATPARTSTGNSVSAACDALESEATAASAGTREGSKLFYSRTTGAADVLAETSARWEKAAAAVENEKISELAADAGYSITRLSEVITKLEAGSSNFEVVDALTTVSINANAAFDALTTACDWSQSVAAACDGLQGEAVTVSAELSVASGLLSTDPTTGAGMLAEAAARFEKAATSVENEDVSELAEGASGSLNRFSDLINVLAADPDDPDEDALAAGSDELNAAFNELATTCDW